MGGDRSTGGQSPSHLLLGLLSVSQLVSWGSLYYAFSLFVVPIEQELGATRVEVSAAFSMALLAMAVLGPPTGLAIDRGHARFVLISGSIASGVAFLLLGRIGTLGQLYLCWILMGACMAFALYDATFAVLTRHYPFAYRHAITVVSFLGGLASTVFLPLTAWLVEREGWRGACVTLAASQFLVCLPAIAIAFRMLPAVPDRPVGSKPLRNLQVSRLVRSAPFLLIAACLSLQMATVAGLTVHLIPLLMEEGFSLRTAVAVASSVGVMQTAGRLFLFFFERRLPRRKADLVMMSLLPVSLAVLALATRFPWMLAAFALLYGAGNGMMTIVKGTAIAEYVSRENIGTLSGLIAVPHALARAMGPSLIAAMWSANGGYAGIVWFLCAATTLAILALWGAQKTALRPA